MSQTIFDNRDWVSRLGAALDQVAARTRPRGVSFHTEHLPNPGPIRLYEKEVNRQYRQLAARARHDQQASELFDRSFLWLDSVPPDVIAILREHPLLYRLWSGSGSHDGFHWQGLLSGGHVDLKFLVSNLAKSSVKLSGKRVATMLHRFLIAGEHTRLHAHEITLLHGLIVDGRIDLAPGAYLASYETVKSRFGLPDEPESWLGRSGLQPGSWNRSRSQSVFVRSVSWGPGVSPCDCPTGNDQSKNIRYSFPDRYTVNSLERFFGDRSMLIQLLSVATQSKLVFHTVFHALPPWMRDLDPNFRLQNPGGRASPFDVWPEDFPLSEESVVSFVESARGWLSYPSKKRHAIELATRRIVASFGPATGMFGLEDRILDVAIALEIMYGPFDAGEITHKLRTRAAWLLGISPDDRRNIVEQIKTFYAARSAIVHSSANTDREKLERALPLGRDLARRTLTLLLTRGPVPNWDELVIGGNTSHAARPDRSRMPTTGE